MYRQSFALRMRRNAFEYLLENLAFNNWHFLALSLSILTKNTYKYLVRYNLNNNCLENKNNIWIFHYHEGESKQREQQKYKKCEIPRVFIFQAREESFSCFSRNFS